MSFDSTYVLLRAIDFAQYILRTLGLLEREWPQDKGADNYEAFVPRVHVLLCKPRKQRVKPSGRYYARAQDRVYACGEGG